MGEGSFVVLPRFPDLNAALRILLIDVIPKVIEERVIKSGALPYWVKSGVYSFPSVKRLAQERREIDEKLKRMEFYEGLLYATGSQLKDVVKSSFDLLGFETNILPVGIEPDLQLKHDRFIGIVEVKGLEKYANRGHLRQLMDYFMDEKQYKGAKGIFVVNHFWYEEPKLREDKPAYTEGATDLARRHEFCLIMSIDLYRAVEQIVEGRADESYIQSVREKIMSGVGLTKLP